MEDVATSAVDFDDFIAQLVFSCNLSGAEPWLKQCLEGYVDFSTVTEDESQSHSKEEAIKPNATRTGTIYPNEVLLAMTRPLAVTYELKAQVVLRCVNEDGDNNVSHDELCRFIRSHGRIASDDTTHVMEALQLMDKDKDGEISIKEVITAIQTDPKIKDYFAFMFKGLQGIDRGNDDNEMTRRASAAALEFGKGYAKQLNKSERTSLRAKKAASQRRNSWMHGLKQHRSVATSSSAAELSSIDGARQEQNRVTNCTAQERTEAICDGLLWGGSTKGN